MPASGTGTGQQQRQQLCEMRDDLPIVVAALREEVERLKGIRDPEAASQEAEDPLPSHHIRHKKGTPEKGGRNGNRSLLEVADESPPTRKSGVKVL